MKTSLIGVLLLALVATITLGYSGVVFAADYPPGISYSSLLDGVILYPKDGRFCLQHIQATFMPDPKTRGWAILTKDGTEIYRYEFKVEKMKPPYFLMDFYKARDLRDGKDIPPYDIKLTESGNYVLDFYLDSGKFYTFPFSISKLEASDPFSERPGYFIDGAWEKWGYLFYTEANPKALIEWKIWLRTKSTSPEKSVKISIDVKNSAGKVVAMNRSRTNYTLQQQWSRRAFDLVNPKGETIMQAGQFLSKDGDYTLTMKIDNKLYGTWKFKIAGGKLNYTGRTVRGKENPLTFVEGGRDAWWYEKQ